VECVMRLSFEYSSWILSPRRMSRFEIHPAGRLFCDFEKYFAER
jgi:hypothetical protein